MKTIDILAVAFNIILGIIYVPFSLLCRLLLMVSEGTIGATNHLYISWDQMSMCGILVSPKRCSIRPSPETKAIPLN